MNKHEHHAWQVKYSRYSSITLRHLFFFGTGTSLGIHDPNYTTYRPKRVLGTFVNSAGGVNVLVFCVFDPHAGSCHAHILVCIILRGCRWVPFD